MGLSDNQMHRLVFILPNLEKRSVTLWIDSSNGSTHRIFAENIQKSVRISNQSSATVDQALVVAGRLGWQCLADLILQLFDRSCHGEVRKEERASNGH